MNKLYPLKFKPLFKEKIWGGTKIKDVLGMDIQHLSNCGEAWVLSGVTNNETIVKEGFLEGNELNELIEVYMEDLVGEKVFDKYKNEFPILVKFIDANDYLSIQVHPDDALAQKRGLGNGKTEMWYIISADEGSELIAGFSRKLDQDSYLSHLKNKTLNEVLNIEKVEAGNVFFMPAGRIHALGPGILLAEIQQTSDVTYRIYDYDRKDSNGQLRELHIEEALEAIDFTVYDDYRSQYPEIKNKSVELVNQPCFTTNLMNLNQSFHRDYGQLDSFVILTCVEGKSEIQYPEGKTNLRAGECLLVPAIMDQLLIKPNNETKIMETFIL
ncbi:MAG TPA: mannose-6-phosphate isomerase [Bacteroidales bacterium]|nr:mannose-6-phosphate isomerase [Bacteroidales bacterium]HRW97185.1 mannose-6-phosphate isomerase [Bacteroidales bacterium]